MMTGTTAALPHGLNPLRAASGRGEEQDDLRALRAVVVARDEVVRHGLLHVLAGVDGVRVVAHRTIGDPADLARLADRVDLVLLDPNLGNGPDEGLHAVRRLRQDVPALKVVLLGGELGDRQILAAAREGIDAVVSRSSPSHEIADVVRRVAAGDATLDHACTAATIRALRHETEAVPPLLTPREREVVGLVARGQRNRTIARALFITEATVKFHVHNILDKLGAQTRAEVVAIAMRMGLDEVAPATDRARGPDRPHAPR